MMNPTRTLDSSAGTHIPTNFLAPEMWREAQLRPPKPLTSALQHHVAMLTHKLSDNCSNCCLPWYSILPKFSSMAFFTIGSTWKGDSIVQLCCWSIQCDKGENKKKIRTGKDTVENNEPCTSSTMSSSMSAGSNIPSPIFESDQDATERFDVGKKPGEKQI